ncbi:unnamed protein product [Blepharisma stoltei]|uniref:Uncharacterized protein n=1 Tax=Blepharisma stoltei TaxID=1481888 RepID=A0AAU9K5R1_9CILI|nr:unnamed protein product [Blepharisma stoltei]
MQRSKPKSIRFELLKQFTKTGNRIKKSESEIKKPEKILNIFFNKFYNLVRSFWKKCSSPEYDRVKDLAEPEVWDQLFLSCHWSKKFVHKEDKIFYNLDSHKAQFSIKSCNFLMTQFLCLSTILQEYGKILSEKTEEALESLFNYRCLKTHKSSGNSKNLWVLLIMDLAYIGKEVERSQNLELAYGFLSTILEENSQKQTTQEEQCISDQYKQNLYETLFEYEKSSYDQELLSTLDTLGDNDGKFLVSNIEPFCDLSPPDCLDNYEFDSDYYLY